MAVSVVSDFTNQPEPSLTFVFPSAILHRLTAETRDEHDAVEQVLDLMSSALTRDGYRQRLAKFYGFYAPLEKELKDCGKHQPEKGEKAEVSNLSPGTRSALAARLNKTALLQLDLHHLGAIWQSSHFAPVVVVEDSDEDFDSVTLQTALAKVR